MRKQPKTIIIMTTIIVIAIILLLNSFSVLATCCPELLNEILKTNVFEEAQLMNPSETIESSLLSSGLSIIGIAISVWAGLNIINVLERKEYESLKIEVKELKNELANSTVSVKKIKSEQNKTDKAKFLNEMYNTIQDYSTKTLIEKIRHIPEPQDISYLSLVEVERIFNSVYQLHQSGFRYHEQLLNEAYGGIYLCEELLKYSSIHPSIHLYLEYRIAEFNFYSGYCCEKSERKTYFDNAIKRYLSVYDFFGAQLPIYNPTQNYPNIDFIGCAKNKTKISAYFCNSIGEAYSKIIEAKEHIFFTDSEIQEYSKKAIFYCAYASYWDNRETYWRNLGCAIERCYGVTSETYEQLNKIYQSALAVSATSKAFKVLLSASDKFINYHLKIKDVDINKGREIPLNDPSYEENWKKFDQTMKEKLLHVLSIINENAKCAKIIHPSEEVGYIYSCIYHRDMCLINGNDRDIVKKHLLEAKDNLNVLKVLNPKGALTKILSADLDSLS